MSATKVNKYAGLTSEFTAARALHERPKQIMALAAQYNGRHFATEAKPGMKATPSF